MTGSGTVLLLCTLSTLMVLSRSADIILPASAGSSGPTVALIIVHGAEIGPSAYTPLATSIQEHSDLSLWVGIPKVDLNVPGSLAKAADRILGEMKNEGMSTSTVFYAGHSYGSLKVQEYCYEYSSNCTGTMLLAGFLLRNASDYSYSKGYPTPTLTIGGELDGLTRLTRLMESYYHQVQTQPVSLGYKFPVVVLQGATHMQWASGTPPPLVKKYDLRPEVSDDDAHSTMGDAIAGWMDFILDSSNTLAMDKVSQYIQQTSTMLAPLIEAFYRESYYYFETPCYEMFPSYEDGDSCCRQGGECWCGNRWTPISQQLMGGDSTITYRIYDVMHPVSQVPAHLAHINNSCTLEQPDCTLDMNTVSENIYPPYIATDNSLFPLAATEIRSKLKSRQAILTARGYTDVDFDESDGPSRCAQINRYVYDWALDTASVRAQERFKKLGQRLIMGEDTLQSSGYSWIKSPMVYTSVVIDGVEVLQVNSTGLSTPLDFWEKNSRGMHYCKILSPAFAMEWIYVDGLRLRDSLSSSR